VLATFSEGLSTPAVYRRFDELMPDASPPMVPQDVMQALARGDAAALGSVLYNDLQRAAVSLRPQLGRVLDYGLEYGALGAIVSGSGPTCAFLTSDESHAIDLVVALMGSGLVDGALHAHGPVHGTRVM
jgi:4-diphosphocytidyl-2-C-methyl-D-erythritol kinase